jgi:hypothetical protein
MSFDDDLKKQQEDSAPAAQPTGDASIRVGGNLYTFRFTRMRGIEWATEIVKKQHKPRTDVTLDSHFGYNVHSVVRAVAPLTGARVEGDELVTMEPKRWKALFDSLDSAGVQSLVDTIWGLNEWDPRQELEDAKKALSGSQNSSDSPSA